MARKFIAAMVLLATVAWAEVAVAPLFTIHAAHMVAMKPAQNAGHEHAMLASHPCCPKIHGTATAIFELTAAVVPCEEQHRCCFGQGPASAPSPTQNHRRTAPEVATVLAERANPAPRTFSIPTSTPELSAPPGALGMVLRI